MKELHGQIGWMNRSSDAMKGVNSEMDAVLMTYGVQICGGESTARNLKLAVVGGVAQCSLTSSLPLDTQQALL